MGFFTNIFNSPSQKEKKWIPFSLFGGNSSSSSIKQEKKIKSTESRSTEKSSLDKDFKYNEEGRSYHGNPDIKYVFPNDDDGINNI